ncbi:MAG TPA: SDR family oxidoreductase [Euzebyales bacterium]|nr:SDR family oxidoreductase [Euzebyales bacterium]
MPEWQRALVTGASSGIGEAFAQQLAARRSNLVLVARDGERLEKLAVALRGAHGVTVDVLPADLTTDDGTRAVRERLEDDAEPVDLLVNNAGVGTSGAFGDVPLERELRLIRLNVTAVVELAHAAVAAMKRRRHGGVLNVSSLSALQPYPFGATYGASKAFVNSFSKALATEAGGHGVKVLALCPGFTRTGFQRSAGISRTPIPDWLWLQPEQVAREGLAALRAGRSIRVVGPAFRAWAALTKVVPDVVIRRALAGAGKHRT